MKEHTGSTQIPIIFLAALSRTIGVGHASRVRTLALECLRRQQPAIVVLKDPENLSSGLDWTGLDVRKLTKNTPWLDAVGLRRRILVTDLPGLDASTSMLAREAGFKFLVHLCIDSADHYFADLFVNASPGVLPLTPVSKFRSVGTRFAVIRPEIRNERPLASWARGRVKRALVAMGGSDAQDMATSVANHLKASTGIEPTILAGPAVPSNRLGHWRKAGFIVEVSPPASGIAPLMLQHDVVVTPGGVTSFEAMHLGVPVLCVASNSQAWFCRNLAAAGMAILLDHHGPVYSNGFDAERLAATAASSFEAIDGQGAARTISTIVELGQ